ncbi:peptide MFS transporter [Galactobacter caseinivorans]|uniref:MFS transporter n=1 Tax=Galactobacter caseinivorans TaxID=2676123 RepID=A0A496PM12_9MICC|nr:oligopeptide:H+ symporter [Galactobacter caseinivorans]RKW71565.1 MFS transporter [Galactobacter caseinivorans]
MSQPTQPKNSSGAAPATGGRGFFGHPMGLANLAGVEMWERFSFYGMQSLLIAYIILATGEGGLGMTKGEASSIVGAYGGWVYLAAVLGSWGADRLFGPERTLVVGASIIMAGHIWLTFMPGLTGLIGGLVLVGLGSGTLKATTSTVLGSMYALEDRRRDAGFSIYYMGVNIGAFLGQTVTVLLSQSAGIHWGFALAAIGMAIGLAQYLSLRKHTRNEVTSRVPNPLKRGQAVKYFGGAAIAVAIIVVLFATKILTAANLSGWMTISVVAATLLLFTIMMTSREITTEERRHVKAFVPLFIAGAVFWSLFQQQFTVVPLYAENRLDLNIFGWDMPFNLVNNFQPLFVIILAGVFAAMWSKLGDRQPSTPVKYAIGTVLMGAAFLAFLPFTGMANGTVPLIMMIVVLLIFTLAELSISPIGQSLATKLAPGKFQSQMVALYFLTISLGSAAAGYLGQLYPSADSAGPTLTENTFFLLIGGSAVAVGLVLFLVRKPILKLMDPVL